MQSTPRERLLDALEFRDVEIIPVGASYGNTLVSPVPFLEDDSLPAEKRRLLAQEMALNPPAVTMFHYLPEGPDGPPEGERDEWGVRWERNLDVDHPIKEWEDLVTYEFPEVHRDLFPAEEIAECRQNGTTLILGGAWQNTTFERYRTLRGFENCLTDPILFPDNCLELISRIDEYNLKVIAVWVELGCDIIGFADDLGSMQQTLLSPELWRTFYKPSCKRICGAIHEGGARTWMHSDGAIADIIPDLIEAGLDILDPVQAECIDIRKLAREYSRRIVVWGGFDSHLIARGTYESVKSHASDVIETFRGFEGGMVGTKSNYLLPSIDVALALYHAFRNH